MTKAMPVHSTLSIAADSHDASGSGCAGQVEIASGRVSSAATPRVAEATAAGGRPVRWRRTRLMPRPYSSEAVAPANAAAPTLMPATLPLARTTTPANPASSATARRVPMRSPKNRKPISAVNSTVIALAIAPMPAGARCAAQANRRNGTAELIAPISASFGHSRSGNCPRARHRNGSSTIEPSASRTSTSGAAPKSGAGTRMNRNEAPQIAPSTHSSSGVSHAASTAAAGAVAAVGFWQDMASISLGERRIVLHRPVRTSAYFLAKAQTGFVARMTLRSDLLPALVAFESAARHQNFAHAAEELHLTASAVSHHVRKLESRLGVALFQRHVRGVSLTAEGRH